MIVIDHARRRYRARDLNDIPQRSEANAEVEVKRASDRIMMHGLTCYPWRLDSGRQKIEACVRGLPGPFDTNKLETLMGKDVPAWLEQLVKLEYLPIAATVTEGGRELYKLELVQYSPDPVPENELVVPENYQKL